MKKLNAVIYNNLVKTFNDLANSREIAKFPEYRKMVVDLRKKFPTYTELLALDLWYIDKPWIDLDGEKLLTKSWICDTDDENHIDINSASIVHRIDFVRGANPSTCEPIVALQIHGIPKLEYDLLKKVLSK